MSKARNLADFISNPAVEATEIANGAVTADKLANNAVTSDKLTYPLTTFSSTGIDDNAVSTAITIDSNQDVGIRDATNPLAPFHLTIDEEFTGLTDPIARLERFTTGDNHYLDITVDNANNLIGFQSTGTNDGGFTFGGAATERMRIDASGNVGIGTISPVTSLHVVGPGTGSGEGDLIAATATNGGNAGLRFRTGSSDRFSITTIGSAGSESLRFRDVNNNTERMRIESGGNMLLGTANNAWSNDGRIISGGTRSVAGGVGYSVTYNDGQSLINIGGMYSSSHALIGFAVESDKSSVDTFISSADNIAWDRGALTVGNELKFYSANAVSANVGTTVSMSQRFRVSDVGYVGIGQVDPGYGLHVFDGNNTGNMRRVTIESNTLAAGNNGGYRLVLYSPNSTLRAGGYYLQPGDSLSDTFLGLSADDQNYSLVATSEHNIGIGLNNPTYGRLTVETDGTTATNTPLSTTKSHLYLNDANSPTGQAVNIDFGYNNRTSSTARISAVQNTSVGTQLVFSTSNNYGAMPVERMRILEGGRIFMNDGPSATLGGFGVESVGGMNVYPDAGFVAINADTSNHALYIAKTSAATAGYINFATNGNTRGAIVEEGANIGIRFGSTATSAHTLDDYEEGTWTPVLRTSNLNGSYTAGTIQSAKYTKVGNVVYYSFYCTGMSQTTAGTGTMQIAGLPFNSVGGLYSGGLSTYGDTVANGLGGRHIVQSGNSYLRLLNENTGGDLAATAWSNVSNMIIVGMYWTA